MRKFAGFVMAVILLFGVAFAGDWAVIPQKGRDYVTFSTSPISINFPNTRA
jgi:hypothetical protein